MKKKTIFAAALLITVCVVALILTACNATDFERRLIKEGYEVSGAYVKGDIDPDEEGEEYCGIVWYLNGYRQNSDQTVNSVVVYKYDTAQHAKAAEKIFKREADGSFNVVRKNNILILGDEQGVKDAQ